MKRMKWFSIIVVIMLVVSACGSSNNSGSESNNGNTSSQTEDNRAGNSGNKGKAEQQHVRFVTVESDPPSVAAFRELIAEFEELNPDIKINLEILGADQLSTRLTAAIAAGSPPDVSQADPKMIVEFANKGYLEPMNDVIDRVGRDQWVPGSIVRMGDTDWSVPYAGTAAVLWYRKDLFEEHNVKPPTNWKEFLEAAEKLTMDTDGDGKTDIYGISIPAGQNSWTENVFYMFMWANGQTLFDKNLNLTLNTQATLEALNMYKQLAQFAPPDIGTYSYYETIDAYGAGKTAMSIYEGRLLSRVAANNPAIEPHTAALQWPAEKVEITEGIWKSYVVYKDSAVKEAAKKWVEFITTGKQSTKFLKTVPGHLLPPTTSPEVMEEYANHPLLQNHKEDFEVIMNSKKIAISQLDEPGVIQNGKVVYDNLVLNPYMGTISSRNVIARMVQSVVLAGMDPQEAINKAEQEILEIMKEMDAQLSN